MLKFDNKITNTHICNMRRIAKKVLANNLLTFFWKQILTINMPLRLPLVPWVWIYTTNQLKMPNASALAMIRPQLRISKERIHDRP